MLSADYKQVGSSPLAGLRRELGYLPQLHFISTFILRCAQTLPVRYRSNSDQESYIRLLTGANRTQPARSTYRLGHPSVRKISTSIKMSNTPASGEVPPGAGTSWTTSGIDFYFFLLKHWLIANQQSTSQHSPSPNCALFKHASTPNSNNSQTHTQNCAPHNPNSAIAFEQLTTVSWGRRRRNHSPRITTTVFSYRWRVRCMSRGNLRIGRRWLWMLGRGFMLRRWYTPPKGRKGLCLSVYANKLVRYRLPPKLSSSITKKSRSWKRT